MRRVVIVLAVAALAGCGSPGTPKDAVAKVGGETVTVTQLDGLMRAARAYYRDRKKPFPAKGTAAYRRLQDDSIKRLLQGAVFVDEAKREGFGVADSDVDNAIETLKAEQYQGSDDKLREAIAAAGLTYEEFLREERVQIAETSVQNAVTSKAHVSESAALAYYTAHKSDYRTSDSRPVRHILVKTKARADALYARLKAGASFVALMQKYSTDTASKQGNGKMTDTRGLFVPPFEKVAFALRTGEVSKPVHSQFGWHIIQALGPVQHAAIKPFAEVKSSVEAVLLPARQRRALKNFQDALYRTYCNGRITYAKGYSSTFCVGH